MTKLQLPTPTIIIKDKKILVKYVAAMLLGDGCLRRRQESWNAFYHQSQIKKHEDYVFWKADILHNISRVSIWESPERTQTTGAIGKACYHMDTGAVPFYTTIYERTYIDRVKRVSPHDLKLFDWESMAIWYMDDGYYHNIHAKSYICTDNFSFGDCLLLKKVMYEKLGIMTGITRRRLKDSYGYRISISRKSMDMFFDGMYKYIKPSYYYKLSRTNDSSFEDDEIVRASEESEEVGGNDLSLEEIPE